MHRPLILLYTFAIAAGFVGRALAAAPPTFSFDVARAAHPLPLDPSLSDPAWKAGAVPNHGPWEDVTTRTGAPNATTAYLLYDDRYLYVAFVAQQPGVPISASQTTNDVGFGTDDFVGIGIDTSGAGSQAYFFETTPKGVRYEQASESARYRPQWESAAAIDGSTWRAVMRIPLNAMRLRGGATQTWRIGFFRQVAARAEHYSWAFDPLMQDGPSGDWPTFNDLRYWPAAKGIALKASATARPRPRAEIYALGSAGADRNVYQQSDGAFLQEKTRSLGADLTYPITETINFVGTLNPDFSNVEVDQQTIAPQEFARQLAEYRPFFAQGAQYLNPNPSGYTNFNGPGNEVFYSPSVGPFDRGVKIEGTYGLQSFGLLSFRGFNEVTGDTFDDQAFGFHHGLQDQTFQYWADGVVAHHSVADDDATVEYGAKWRNLHNKMVYSINFDDERGSWVPQGSARSANAFIDEHQSNYEINLGYVDISPNYDPLDGYTSTSDIRGLQGFVNFLGSTPGTKTWNLFMSGDRFQDRSGAVHEADFAALLGATFKNGFSLDGMGPSMSLLRSYDGNFFTGYPNYPHPQNVPFNLFSLPIGYGDGTPRPIDASAAWGSFGGNWQHLYTVTTSRPLGNRYTLGLEYDGSYQRNLSDGTLNSQWLRRVSLGYNIGSQSNLTLSLRAINGTGGFALPGINLAVAYHARFRNGDVYVNYGSPSSIVTLNRLIVKYVFRAGGDAGT